MVNHNARRCSLGSSGEKGSSGLEESPGRGSLEAARARSSSGQPELMMAMETEASILMRCSSVPSEAGTRRAPRRLPT